MKEKNDSRYGYGIKDENSKNGKGANQKSETKKKTDTENLKEGIEHFISRS